MVAAPACRAGCVGGDEIAMLWHEYKCHAERGAREHLVHLYYPLVRHVARSLAPMLSRQAGIDDLEGYGALGLIDAVDRYDPNRGVRFPTFAVHRIRGAIYDGMRASDWVPRSVRRKARAIEEAHAALCAAHGRAPTEDEEAAALEVSVGALRAGKAQVAAARVTSLDADGAGDGERGVAGISGDAAEPLSAYIEQETRQMIRAAICKLSERERAVAVMSFGEGMTLAEIGRTLGVTESRVCQIRTSAIKRLRDFVCTAEGVPHRPPEPNGRVQWAGGDRAG